MADALRPLRDRSRTSPPSRVSKSKWDAAWTEQGTYLFDRVRGRRGRPRRDLLASTLPRRRRPGACTSATSSATRTPTSRCATSACAARPCSTRWAGTTTACPPSAACRTTTACAATRRCRTTPTSLRRTRAATTRAAAPPTRCRSAAATSSSCARRLTVEDEKHFEDAVAPARPERRLDADLPHDLGRHDPHEPARVPAQPRARRGLPGARPDAVGHRLPLRDRAGRARGPRPAGRLPPGRLPQDRRLGRRPHRDDPPRAARRRASPSSRTPTTSATSRSSARPCAPRSSTSRCPCSRTRSPSPTRARASP